MGSRNWTGTPSQKLESTKGFIPQKIGGGSKGALDGLILGVDCSETLKKIYVRQKLCSKLRLSP